MIKKYTYTKAIDICIPPESDMRYLLSTILYISSWWQKRIIWCMQGDIHKQILRSLFLFLLFSILIVNFSVGQNKEFHQEYAYVQNFTSKEGLSHQNISALIKDSEGFLWFGTDNGLNRFDGYNFEVFKHSVGDSTTIGDNKIYALLLDSKGRFWIGTNLGGLQLFDKRTKHFRKFIHSPVDTNSLSNNTIQTIIEDSDGYIWIGTNLGLNRFNPETETFNRIYYNEEATGLASNHINSLLEYDEDFIWAGTLEGLSVIDKKTLKIKNYHHDPDDPNSLAYNSVSSLIQDSEGQIWLGTEGGGLSRYNKENDTFINYFDHQDFGNNSPRVIHSIAEDGNGNIWFGSWGKGIFIFSKRQNTFSKLNVKKDPGLNNAIIYRLLNTNDGNMWVGTYEKGVWVLSNKRKNFEHVEIFNYEMSELGRNTVREIMEDRNKNIWIGTDGAALYQYSPELDSYYHYYNDPGNQSFSGSIVKSLLEDSAGNIYAGTYAAGLNRINPKTKEIITFYHDLKDPNSINNNSIWALYLDRENRIWAGTLGGGLDEFLPNENKFIHHTTDPENPLSISSNRIAKIMEDSKGNFWVGTIGGGICKMDKQNRTFKRYQENVDGAVGVTYNEIIDIYEDKKNRLWVTTNGGGLYQYNYQKDKFEKTGKNHNLKSTILSILDDDMGNLWMGTYHGIAKYNPEKGSVIYYDQHDGLQGNDFKSNSKLISSTGEFYFGGSNGLNIFRPEEITEDSSKYPIVFTSLHLFHEIVKIDNQNSILKEDINYQEKIVLNANQNTLTFQYSCLEFTFPKKSIYAYKLEGFDDYWNYVQDRRNATYTNIPPGDYEFKVKATNNDGIWNEDYKSIQVVITPPFWKTWWFRITFFILVLALVFLYINSRTRKLTKTNIELEKKVTKRTQQLNKLVKELQENKAELTATLEDLYTQKQYVDNINDELEETHKELKTINEELDKRVQVRTSKLAKANKELDRFVYSASHDLSSPIKSILGLINLTKLENQNDSLDQHLDHMEKSVYKLEDVILSLTQFSRNMGSVVSVNEFVFDKLIQEILFELKFQTDKEKVNIVKKYNLTDTVKSDYYRLKIILSNLISNAIKYHDIEKPESWIEISIAHKEPNYIFSIKDNGIGIETKLKRKVFKMFYRGTTVSTGSGLGLFIVKETIDKMKGKIEVDTKIGESTEISVILPYSI